MTNEQLAILLIQQKNQLQREIDDLNTELVEHDMEQHRERRHDMPGDAPCNNSWLLPCMDQDHYRFFPNGNVVCLDGLRSLVGELDAHIAMLRPEGRET